MKANGLAYERKFIRHLQRFDLDWELHPHQWMDFYDENGRGLAQVDVFAVLQDKIILFECKLSENLSAHVQLRALYGPLLEYIYERPVVMVQVCKNLRHLNRRRHEVGGLADILASDGSRLLTWHWLP